MKVIGEAGRNRTVEELMKAIPRTGADYVDLRTGNLVTEVTATKEETVTKETEVSEGDDKHTREELEDKKMSELRDIGDPLGAKDTKKSELIEEILEKQ